VRREGCPDDRRATNAVLTEAGFAHLEASAPAHVEEVRAQVFNALTPEQVATMAEGLGRILRSVDPGSTAAPEGSC
jgi:DNA-binding MarR family transcriptional regulator